MSEKRCAICGALQRNDLFAAVTGSPTCAICTAKYMGGLPQTAERVATASGRLGLQDGEYLQQDNGKEAARLLGRA